MEDIFTNVKLNWSDFHRELCQQWVRSKVSEYQQLYSATDFKFWDEATGFCDWKPAAPPPKRKPLSDRAMAVAKWQNYLGIEHEELALPENQRSDADLGFSVFLPTEVYAFCEWASANCGENNGAD